MSRTRCRRAARSRFRTASPEAFIGDDLPGRLSKPMELLCLFCIRRCSILALPLVRAHSSNGLETKRTPRRSIARPCLPTLSLARPGSSRRRTSAPLFPVQRVRTIVRSRPAAAAARQVGLASPAWPLVWASSSVGLPSFRLVEGHFQLGQLKLIKCRHEWRRASNERKHKPTVNQADHH